MPPARAISVRWAFVRPFQRSFPISLAVIGGFFLVVMGEILLAIVRLVND